jgi:biopolymer transport protein TolQ
MDSVLIEPTVGLVNTDFSLWALFLRADFVVQGVMIGLILASVFSWAIIIEKWRLVRRYSRLSNSFENKFWSGEPLNDLYRVTSSSERHPLANIFTAAMREWARGDGAGKETSAKATSVAAETLQRIDRALTVSIGREMVAMESRMLFLATVGSVAPFIGLFGTVWGIMNSFQAIAVTRDTNLAVVAPGIAEALFATGLGLLAAIPAVIGYNMFNASFAGLGNRMDIFADEFIAFVSRQKGRG